MSFGGPALRGLRACFCKAVAAEDGSNRIASYGRYLCPVESLVPIGNSQGHHTFGMFPSRESDSPSAFSLREKDLNYRSSACSGIHFHGARYRQTPILHKLRWFSY
jgi:hypothetical protein